MCPYSSSVQPIKKYLALVKWKMSAKVRLFFKKKFFRVTKPKLEPWRGGGDLELGVFQKRGTHNSITPVGVVVLCTP